MRKSDEDGCGGEEKERKTEAQDSVNLDLGEKGCITGLCGCNLSDTSTLHRSGKR